MLQLWWKKDLSHLNNLRSHVSHVRPDSEAAYHFSHGVQCTERLSKLPTMHLWIGPLYSPPFFFCLSVVLDHFLIIYHEIVLCFCFSGESLEEKQLNRSQSGSNRIWIRIWRRVRGCSHVLTGTRELRLTKHHPRSPWGSTFGSEHT